MIKRQRTSQKLHVESSSYLRYAKHVLKRSSLLLKYVRGNFIWNDQNILKCCLYKYTLYKCVRNIPLMCLHHTHTILWDLFQFRSERKAAVQTVWGSTWKFLIIFIVLFIKIVNPVKQQMPYLQTHQLRNHTCIFSADK